MTMRYETKYEIGDVGAVYEFNVKMYHLRGVNITDDELEIDVNDALDSFADQLRKRYKWIGRVYLTGRSGGWLAIEDRTGKARKATLEKIDDTVNQAVRDFQSWLRKQYGEA
jgi:hypothetical protein